MQRLFKSLLVCVCLTTWYIPGVTGQEYVAYSYTCGRCWTSGIPMDQRCSCVSNQQLRERYAPPRPVMLSPPSTANEEAPKPEVDEAARRKAVLLRARKMVLGTNEILAWVSKNEQYHDNEKKVERHFQALIALVEKAAELLEAEDKSVGEELKQWRTFATKLEGALKAQLKTNPYDSFRREQLPQLRKLFRAGDVPGPAPYRKLPGYVLPTARNKTYCLEKKWKTRPASTWSPPITDTDRQGLYRKAYDKAIEKPYPVLYKPRAARRQPEQFDQVDMTAIKNDRKSLVARYEYVRPLAVAIEKRTKELEIEFEKKRLKTTAIRKQINAKRKSIHGLRVHTRKLAQDAVISRAMGATIKKLDVLLPQVGDTANAGRKVASLSGFVFSLKRITDYQEAMHKRLEPGGPMERFFEGLKAVIASNFDSAAVDEFAEFLRDDFNLFASETIGFTVPPASWWNKDLRPYLKGIGK